MTIYVDEVFTMRPKGAAARFGNRWCHLVSDQLDPTELHEFAAKLGLKREWFQQRPNCPWYDHYDIVGSRRKAALKLGAQPLKDNGLGDLLIAKRKRHLGQSE